MTEPPFRITDRTVTAPLIQDVSVIRPMLWKVRMRGAFIGEVDIEGAVEGLRINGVDVGPLIEAELDRREPLRVKMRPADPAGYREAWDLLGSLWADTVAKARTLPEEKLHEQVDGEWSFVQTLRHLLFATDIWISRVILGDPRPWHPLDLPFDEMPPDPEVPWDRDVRPSLDEVLALRADRVRTMGEVIDGLTPEYLASRTVPVDGPGFPEPRDYPVGEVLTTILIEEWYHRKYAERDLDILLGQDR
ncbi:DinB family protein [Nakamurella sp. YIM 132087]|uniref:DinB family protein n=1 Tax=Nakamurella alba TaxID=2665158 RepID=A0A7K1FRZ3_9ACTN|nr:DinB family protein [Nakamurella alba]MTD16917.1 DinB family protein [Nakamurella alba]